MTMQGFLGARFEGTLANTGATGSPGVRMDGARPCVRVVDDDAAVLKAVRRLLQSEGFDVRTFPSAQDFLGESGHDVPGCVVIDASMPGFSGLQLQEALGRAGDPSAVVFISGEGSVASSVQAMKAGAVDFLTKPFEASRLIEAVRAAIAKDGLAREGRDERARIARRLALLTVREREVLEHVVRGRLNKQIAADLGTVEKTIKVHRARVMQKMEAGSVAELARIAERGLLQPAPQNVL
jgi:FixJ family two-component response regulator